LRRILSVGATLGQNDLVVSSIFSEAGGILCRDCPRQNWSAAEALKTACFSAGFHLDSRLRLFGSIQHQKANTWPDRF
jgi:hypothetical protein